MTDIQTTFTENLKIKIPNKWKVLLLNDDSTTMDFVIQILMDIFDHPFDKAQSLTLEIHNTGSAVAGIYSHEIAEQKAIEATHIARHNGFPLQCKMEEE